MAVRSEFKVTAKAGTFVAGQRSPGEGGTLRLTEDQAFWPLRHGEVERPDGKTKPAGRRKAKAEEASALPPAGDPVAV